MEASRTEAEILRKAIAQWHADGLLDGDTAIKLQKSIGPESGSRQQLGQYFLIIAISCSLLAFGALFLDSKLLESLRQKFALSAWTIAASAAGVAALTFGFVRRRLRAPGLTREFHLVLGGLAALTAIVYGCKELGAGRAYTGGLAAAAVLLAALSLGFRSPALWVGALGAAGGWVGAFTYVFSEGGLFLGMNLPLRFAVVGIALFLLSGAMTTEGRLAHARSSTRMVGLLTALISFWAFSVFGNHTSLDAWASVRQTGMIPHALIFAVAGGAALLWGIRRDDALLRDLGLLALLLNGYTRAFEYFWDSINKGLFFLALAISFWLLGRWLAREGRTVPFFGKREREK